MLCAAMWKNAYQILLNAIVWWKMGEKNLLCQGKVLFYFLH
jgi:hypothetical protein